MKEPLIWEEYLSRSDAQPTGVPPTDGGRTFEGENRSALGIGVCAEAATTREGVIDVESEP